MNTELYKRKDDGIPLNKSPETLCSLDGKDCGCNNPALLAKCNGCNRVFCYGTTYHHYKDNRHKCVHPFILWVIWRIFLAWFGISYPQVTMVLIQNLSRKLSLEEIKKLDEQYDSTDSSEQIVVAKRHIDNNDLGIAKYYALKAAESGNIEGLSMLVEIFQELDSKDVEVLLSALNATDLNDLMLQKLNELCIKLFDIYPSLVADQWKEMSDKYPNASYNYAKFMKEKGDTDTYEKFLFNAQFGNKEAALELAEEYFNKRYYVDCLVELNEALNDPKVVLPDQCFVSDVMDIVAGLQQPPEFEGFGHEELACCYELVGQIQSKLPQGSVYTTKCQLTRQYIARSIHPLIGKTIPISTVTKSGMMDYSLKIN